MVHRCAQTAQIHRPGPRLEKRAWAPSLQAGREKSASGRSVELTRDRRSSLKPRQKAPQRSEPADLLLAKERSKCVATKLIDLPAIATW